ncbi:MAG: HAD-IC family P-type ATPase [Nitrospirota bacterium]|nr:MAG: HAD-IC family P-type ATPase [Nitrospirota bacterium]
MQWYQLESGSVFDRLGASHEGLSNAAVAERLAEHGPNALAEEDKISRLKILLHQFTSPLVSILLIASVVTFLLHEYVDTAVIIAVVLLNALIGFIQEYKAEESVRSLKKMTVPKARVLREGKEQEVQSIELVPGDIVMLSSGSKVPADMRLFHAIELRIEEAMLTGESVPAEKVTVAIQDSNLTPGDQRNMAFMGTSVVNGRAKGIVVGTGHNSILGRIATEVREIGSLKAPIQDKINVFARNIGLLVLSASALVMLVGMVMGNELKEMFITAVAAAVATIPEGLPIVVTVTLAIGVSRMARRNAIIRKLHAVETLGSTSTIGSDKTGTLTRNEMTVRLVYDGLHTYELTGTGYRPEGKVLHEQIPVEPETLQMLQQVFRIGMLCNESDLYEENGEYHVDGDPTEGALFVSAIKAGLNPELERESYEQISIIPFESERQYMATLHKKGDRKYVFVKGSLDRLLDICTECMISEVLKKDDFYRIADAFGHEGLRVLAMAYKEVPAETTEISHADVEKGLIFAGLQGMIDPPRDEVAQAIEGCKQAGIRTVMITGDHAVTALAIGRRLGIAEEGAPVLTGKELQAMSDDELFERVKSVSVYARVSPEHKLRIVETLKRHGEIVAVTGDGVNDAPALKSAHIGIAMGRTGTDVAKEAADMIVTDDNFASIYNAVEEGRVVFDNIRKVIAFLIPTGIAAVISIMGALVLGYPIPYVPAQLLWINLVTNGLQDVALAFEPGEKGIAKRKPRDPSEGLMSKLLIQRTVIVGTVISLGVIFNYTLAIRSGDSLEQARTVAVTTMIFFQFFQAWNSRSETRSVLRIGLLSNPFLFFSMITALFAHLAVLYVPAFQWVFRTAPLAITEWIEIISVSVTILLVIEVEKFIRNRKELRFQRAG